MAALSERQHRASPGRSRAVARERASVAVSTTRPRTLGRSERRVVRALAEAMFSEDGEVASEQLDAHVDRVDAFIGAASSPTRFGLRIALLVVRLSPILFLVRFTTVERLAIALRVPLLARLERSNRAMMSLAFIGWRTISTLVFYEDEAELRAIGYREDRSRYRLPMVAGVDQAAPVPLESGVRLRAEEGSHEVRTSADAADSEDPIAAAEDLAKKQDVA